MSLLYIENKTNWKRKDILKFRRNIAYSFKINKKCLGKMLLVKKTKSNNRKKHYIFKDSANNRLFA